MSDNMWKRCRRMDASLSGAMVDFGNLPTPTVGEQITLDMRGVGLIQADVIRVVNGRVGLRFDDMMSETRDRLIRRLYTEGLQANVDKSADAKEIAWKMIGRAFGRGPA